MGIDLMERLDAQLQRCNAEAWNVLKARVIRIMLDGHGDQSISWAALDEAMDMIERQCGIEGRIR